MTKPFPYVDFLALSRYECLCQSKDGTHTPLCSLYNQRREQEFKETGIARHWREMEEMTGIERQRLGQ